MRNTKEVALMQQRRGLLSEQPHALHEGEFGLATDKNRLFIGNENHPDLASRTEFPYQNLEILTECSNLDDFFTYRYTNNISMVGGVENRPTYEEKMPIVIVGTSTPNITASFQLSIGNGVDEHIVTINSGATLAQIINTINSAANVTHIFATKYKNLDYLVLVGMGIEVSLSGGAQVANLGLPTTYQEAEKLPERNVSEKLDDNFSIKDYGAVGNGSGDDGELIYKALIGIYQKDTDAQFNRKIFFPAGSYLLGEETPSEPLALIDGTYLIGEGIDRSIIKVGSISTRETLFATYDTQLREYTNSEYGTGTATYPTNIVIENLTIDCSTGNQLTSVITLKGASNVTLRNVKIVGKSGQVKLIDLLGTCENITFDNCIFETAQNGIVSTSAITNLNIRNSLFGSLSTSAISLKPTTGTTIKGCNVINNTFTNCGSTYVIEENQTSGGTVEYCSFVDNKFDKAVIERTGSILPLDTNYNTSGHNYTDILDPATSTYKVMLFNFTQPRWDFLDYLMNSEGYVIQTVKNGSTTTNWIKLTVGNATDDTINANTSANGNLSINTNVGANLILGDTNGITVNEWVAGTYSQNDIVKITNGTTISYYKCSVASTTANPVGSSDWQQITPFIVIKKDLDLYNNVITNTLGDVTLSPVNDKVIKVQNNDSTEYESRIGATDDAIPNVAYVNKIGSNEIVKEITIDDVKSDNTIDLCTFDTATYGNTIHLKDITIDVRVPFSKTYSFKTGAASYTNGNSYYAGDIVSYNSIYYVVKENHTGVDLTKLASIASHTSDTKYVDILANCSTGNYSLMKEMDSDNLFRLAADIQSEDSRGLNPVELSASKKYDNDYASYQDKIYFITNGEGLTKDDLHTSQAKRMKYDGFKYRINYDNLIPTAVSLSASTTAWQPQTSYAVGDLIVYDTKPYTCNTAHTSGDIFSTEMIVPDWVPGRSYVEDDIVYYRDDDVRLQCGVANSDKVIDYTSDHWEIYDDPKTIYWVALSANSTDSSTINFAGSTLTMNFYDNDGIRLSTNNLNAGGKMIVTIHYSKGEL